MRYGQHGRNSGKPSAAGRGRKKQYRTSLRHMISCETLEVRLALTCSAPEVADISHISAEQPAVQTEKLSALTMSDARESDTPYTGPTTTVGMPSSTDSDSTPLVFYHNHQDPLDVNGDGLHTAVDALIVINELNHNGSRVLYTPNLAMAGEIDVDSDGQVSASDAMTVINALNTAAAGGGTNGNAILNMNPGAVTVNGVVGSSSALTIGGAVDGKVVLTDSAYAATGSSLNVLDGALIVGHSAGFTQLGGPLSFQNLTLSDYFGGSASISFAGSNGLKGLSAW